jgi:RNA polymerase sigma factor (sigma-70 family)
MVEEETTNRVRQAQAGDSESFDWLVRRFQDRAVAYAASVLGDLSLAQDAAQSAFVDVFLGLPCLRTPQAFPAWLRTVIFKHCDRLRRSGRLHTIPLESARRVASTGESPEQFAERREFEEQVGRGINALPEGERQVIRLFYMGQHSHREIAEFLGVPVTTVKSRLHEGRLRLRERMATMVKDSMYESRPSRDEKFLARVSGCTTALLGSVGPEQKIEISSRSPLYDLMSSVLVWAIEEGVSYVALVPEGESVSIQFTRENGTRQVAALPERAGRALMNMVKMCADLDFEAYGVTQDGTIPILHNGLGFDAQVSCRPMDQGERVDIYLVRK